MAKTKTAVFKESIIVALVVAERPLGDRVDKELNNWEKMGTGVLFFFLRQENSNQGKESFTFMSLLQTIKSYRSKYSDIQSLGNLVS